MIHGNKRTGRRPRRASGRWGKRSREIVIGLLACSLVAVVGVYLAQGSRGAAAPERAWKDTLTTVADTALAEGSDRSLQLGNAALAAGGEPAMKKAALSPLLEEPEPEEEREPVMDEAALLAVVGPAGEEFDAVGISAAVIENGEVTASCGWGLADLNGRAMTKDTKVRCASISKVVVAICTMRMVEDGYLTLDGSISPFWGFDVSSRAYPDIPITPELLMTHTSTIQEMEGKKTLSAAVSQMSSHPFTGDEPGTVWRYSNYGYGILGTTLELALDGNLDDYVQDVFLQPMGMDASFYTTVFEAGELATLYRGTTAEWSASGQANARLPQGIGEAVGFYSGNFTASAGDFAKLIAMLAGDGVYEGVRYLDASSVQELERPRLAVDNGESAFSQCLTLRMQEDIYGRDVLYYHTGSAYGVYALFSYDPDTKDGVVVISTGADRAVDGYGIYGLCATITEQVYRQLDQAGG